MSPQIYGCGDMYCERHGCLGVCAQSRVERGLAPLLGDSHERRLSDDSPEAIAVLFSGDPETGECTMDVFREGECSVDPITAAEGLRDSCAEDFPDRLWAFTGNDRATGLRSAYLVKQVLGQ